MKPRLIKCFTLATLVLLLSGTVGNPALAADGYKLISTEELKSWMKSTAPPNLIYSLSFVEFEEQLDAAVGPAAIDLALARLRPRGPANLALRLGVASLEELGRSREGVDGHVDVARVAPRDAFDLGALEVVERLCSARSRDVEQPRLGARAHQ